MTDVRFVEFMSSVRERVKQADAVDRVVAVCVGVAVSRMLAVPSTGDSNALSHYDLTLVHTVDQMLSNFNENCVFDIDLAREISRGLWLVRCSASSGVSQLIIPNAGGSFVDVYFGTRLHLAADLVRFMDQNAEAIAAMANRAAALLNVQSPPQVGA